MNKKLTGFKRFSAAAIVLLLGLALALCIIRVPAVSVNAEENVRFSEPAASQLSLANTQFGDSSGSYPASPSSWTGSDLTGAEGNTVSGVISLVATNYNSANKDSDGNYEDKFKLTRYPEYATRAQLPETPFGSGEYVNTNKNVLMINTADSKTAYAYTSASMSFAAGAYYRVSAYVKTGNFPSDQGASIKLKGFAEDVAFRNINTVRNLQKDEKGVPILNKDNMYGFKKYTFYVATARSESKEVTLSLGVGDYLSDQTNENYYYYPAKGYAFFDNVVAEQIPANTYFLDKETYDNDSHKDKDYYLFKDFNENLTYLNDNPNTFAAKYDLGSGDGNDIGSFERGLNGWTRISDLEGLTAKGLISDVYNTRGSFDEDNAFGFEKEYISPIGDRENNSKILVIASKKEKVAAGFRSPKYKILRNTYYRLSFYANTENVSGGAGATAVVRGTNGVADSDNKLVSLCTGITGDPANTLGYGWKQYAFYVRGSYLNDYEISLELWLGQPDSLSSGIAMFDEIKLEKITPAFYGSNSVNGTVVTFDPTFDSTGITNGRFYEVGEYKDYAYPLAPASWTLVKPDSQSITGFATNAVASADDAVSGVISTQSEHFDANRTSYNGATNPMPSTINNLLMISSSKDTAIGYRSSTVSITSKTRYTLTVDVIADRLKGYGANLALLAGSDVIATIENIKTTGTYTFYIEGGLADANVSLDIWLGFVDRKNNTEKLASGNLFVDKVAFQTLEDETVFKNKKAEYETLKTANYKHFGYAVYSFDAMDMGAYDAYSDSVIRTPYDFKLTENGSNTNVTYGIFDYTALPAYPAGQNEIPAYFRNNAPINNGILYLRNSNPGYSTLSMRSSLTLAATSYYRLTIGVKVDLPEAMKTDGNVVGASIALANTEQKFENIKDTVLRAANKDKDVIDREAFKTYTFYIKTGKDANSALLTFSLGASEFPNRYCIGRLYINDITLSTITNTEYEEILPYFDEKGEKYDSEFVKYNTTTDFSEGDETEDDASDDKTEEETPSDTSNEVSWWLVPSILFAIALVIAVVGTFVRRLLERRTDNKSVKVRNSYDRGATLRKLQGGRVATTDSELNATDEYDEFDDNAPIEPAKKQVVSTEESEEELDVTAETTSDHYDEFDDEQQAASEAATTVDGENSEGAPENTDSAEKSEVSKEKKAAVKQKPVTVVEKEKEDYSDSFED